jgi:hypothetical protein
MNDDVLVSLGRQFIAAAMREERMIRRIEELEKELAELKAKGS